MQFCEKVNLRKTLKLGEMGKMNVFWIMDIWGTRPTKWGEYFRVFGIKCVKNMLVDNMQIEECRRHHETNWSRFSDRGEPNWAPGKCRGD
jgi:hypothetical protein